MRGICQWTICNMIDNTNKSSSYAPETIPTKRGYNTVPIQHQYLIKIRKVVNSIIGKPLSQQNQSNLKHDI